MKNPLALVLALALALPGLPALATSKADAEVAELQNYRLTLPVVKKLSQVQENLYSSIKADPSLATRYKDSRSDQSGDGSIDGAAKKLDSMPELKQAIDKAGLTTREYLVASIAMLQAGMASGMAKTPGADTSRLPAGVRANMNFMQENKATMEQLQKRAEEINLESRRLSEKKE